MQSRQEQTEQGQTEPTYAVTHSKTCVCVGSRERAKRFIIEGFKLRVAVTVRRTDREDYLGETKRPLNTN